MSCWTVETERSDFELFYFLNDIAAWTLAPATSAGDLVDFNYVAIFIQQLIVRRQATLTNIITPTSIQGLNSTRTSGLLT